MAVSLDSYGVLSALEVRYSSPEWATFRELRQQTGFQGHGDSIRTIDFAAFNTWPSNKGHRIAIEVKVSRGDFLREIDNPAKHAWVEQIFHETYFAAPHGLLKPDEIPESWGLIGVTVGKSGIARTRRMKVAKRRDVPAYGEESAMMGQLMMSVIRESAKRTEAARKTSYGLPDGTVVTPEHINQIVASECKIETERMRRRVERADEREAAARNAVEPLARLASAAGRWGVQINAQYDVDAMIDKAVAEKMRGLFSKLQHAQSALAELIEVAGEEP